MPILTEARQAFINKQIHAEVLDLERHVAWHFPCCLDQFIIRKTDEGWVAMVKASRHGKPVVAFINGQTFAECLELAGEFAARGCLTWQKDDWPSKRLRRL